MLPRRGPVDALIGALTERPASPVFLKGHFATAISKAQHRAFAAHGYETVVDRSPCLRFAPLTLPSPAIDLDGGQSASFGMLSMRLLRAPGPVRVTVCLDIDRRSCKDWALAPSGFDHPDDPSYDLQLPGRARVVEITLLDDGLAEAPPALQAALCKDSSEEDFILAAKVDKLEGQLHATLLQDQDRGGAARSAAGPEAGPAPRLASRPPL